MATLVLETLLMAGEVGDDEWLELDEQLKPLFFDGGFASQIKENDEDEQRIRAELNDFVELLVNDDTVNADQAVDTYFEAANVLNQGAHTRRFFEIPELFLEWPETELDPKEREFAEVLRVAMETGKGPRDRAILLLSKFVQKSILQSNKSNAGKQAEQAIEIVLRKAGLIKGVGYESQYQHDYHNAGSATDFVFPAVGDGSTSDILAYIAVQGSTNDRTRSSDSELQRGAKAFLCSLNGCSGSSKTTDDIGEDLASAYITDHKTYVVISSERERALAKAKSKSNLVLGSLEKKKIKKEKKEEKQKVHEEQLSVLLSKVYEKKGEYQVVLEPRSKEQLKRQLSTAEKKYDDKKTVVARHEKQLIALNEDFESYKEKNRKRQNKANGKLKMLENHCWSYCEVVDWLKRNNNTST